jgi:exodeoxyribonuclease VII large subunit
MEETLIPVFSVTELNEYVGTLLSADPNLSDIRVSGEISGFKRHSSGHLYFSLKDENALVRCVMFRQQAMRLAFRPEDGMQVVLIGRASLYQKDGSFQLYANAMRKSGEGELFKKFLALKAELEKKGYFAQERKRQIPFLPRCVGVVTSGTGAALQDILNIVGRRFERMPVVLAPVRVQGQGAANEIARAIGRMNEENAADVLIVGRGGGSMEDLWAFNEPIVAEAIVNSRIPVISAVGHETDFTIADFAADLRAPTPSAAAELAVPEMDACYEALRALSERMLRSLNTSVEKMRANVRLFASANAFLLLERRVSDTRQTLDLTRERAARGVHERVDSARAALGQARAKLAALDPYAVLARGYAIVSDGENRPINGVKDMKPDDRVNIRMRDGSAEAEIKQIGNG